MVFKSRFYFSLLLVFSENHTWKCFWFYHWILCFRVWTEWWCCAGPASGHYCENTANTVLAYCTVQAIVYWTKGCNYSFQKDCFGLSETKNWKKSKHEKRTEPHALSGYQMAVNRQLSLALCSFSNLLFFLHDIQHLFHTDITWSYSCYYNHII